MKKIIITTLSLILLLGNLPYAQANSSTASFLTFVQSGDNVDLKWGYGKLKPKSQSLVIADTTGEFSKEFILKNSLRKLKIDGLQKDKLYIATLTSKKPFKVLTTSIKLEPLLTVDSVDLSIGSSSVRVNWEVSESKKLMIDGYLVTAKTANLPPVTVKLGKLFTGYTLQNISKNRSYDITVKALTAAGYGEAIEKNLPSLTPLAPTLSVSALSPTSVKLSWSYTGPNPSEQVIKIDSLEGLARDGEEINIDSAIREYVVDNLTTASTYRFRVYGKNSHGAGALSAPVDQLLKAPTLAPLNFAAILGSASESSIVTLKWALPVVSRNISSFRIDYKRSDESTWGRLVELPSTVLIHEISSLTPGYTYQFRIQSVSATGESEWVQVQASPTGLPSAPSLPLLVAQDGGFTISWNAPSSTAVITGYIIEYSLVGSTATTQLEVPSSSLTRTITGLSAGSYQARVAAKAESGVGPFTSLVSVQPFTKPQPPTTVSAISGTLTNLGKILVSWQPPTDTGGLAIQNYILQYNSQGTWTTQATYASTVTNATISGLTVGTRYSFRVITVTSAGQSQPSDGGASATVLGLPAAPTNLSVTVTNNNGILLAALSWVAPLNTGGSTVTGYSIEVTYNGVTSDRPSQGVATNTEPFYLAQATSLGTYTFRIKTVSDIGVGTESATTTYTVS